MADLLKEIFEAKMDREMGRTIVDIFSSLANIGMDCGKTVTYIEDLLEKDRIDDLETGIDLLKTLVE